MSRPNSPLKKCTVGGNPKFRPIVSRCGATAPGCGSSAEPFDRLRAVSTVERGGGATLLQRPAKRMSRREGLGFTLVEVAASAAILGGIVVGLLLIQSRALRMYALAKEFMTSTRLCASQVTALRAGLASEGEGEFFHPAGYTWRIMRLGPSSDGTGRVERFEVEVTPPSEREEGGASVTIWLPVAEESQK